MGAMIGDIIPKRFSWVVQGGAQGPDPISDVPVLTGADALVVPTVGAIVPNWLLVIPRSCALSLACVSASVRQAVLELAEDAAQRLGENDKALYFEHGSGKSGSVIGCGVDQAHLHVLNTELDILGAALADDSVDWSLTEERDPWARLAHAEYYFIRNGSRSYIGFPRIAQSQFFRKHIARAAGVPWQWDYKAWPNHENIRRTYERFNRAKFASSIA